MKYITETTHTYYPLENKLNKALQVLDIVLTKQNKDQEEESTEQFIEKARQLINKNFKSQITLFQQTEQRGTTQNKDSLISLYLAYDPKDFPEPSQIASQISQIISQENNNNKQEVQEILNSCSYEESEILEKLQSEIQQNDSSFDGSDGDTEDSQKSLKEENKALRQENEDLKKKLALLEQKLVQSQGNSLTLKEQNKENLSIIMDQKHIMDQFQKECNFLTEEKFILTNQNQKQNKEIVNLTHQVTDLLNQTKRMEMDTRGIEENFNKQMDEKQKQINKFVTFFLIQENKGKCFSNDRVKQRTWEVQEMLKEHHMRKYLKESLQLN